MMAIFSTRSLDRDQETDSLRLRRLIRLLNDLVGEMAVERDGLEARCRKTKEDAAFSLLALEQCDDRRMSAKVDQLTTSLILVTNRLKSLQDQIGFIDGLLEEAAAFEQKSLLASADGMGAAGGKAASARP